MASKLFTMLRLWIDINRTMLCERWSFILSRRFYQKFWS
ncbi:hypothetical protein KSF78_0005185 [Schistosoma japonicum]|nr:hypothetical protein KSF78_0005185 [Schistosoma japonicum]